MTKRKILIRADEPQRWRYAEELKREGYRVAAIYRVGPDDIWVRLLDADIRRRAYEIYLNALVLHFE